MRDDVTRYTSDRDLWPFGLFTSTALFIVALGFAVAALLWSLP